MQFVSLDQATEPRLQQSGKQEQTIHPEGCDQHSRRHGCGVTVRIIVIQIQATSGRKHQNSGGFTGDAGSMAAAVLITTLWVDGLFLLSALLQPGLSGLIE